MLFDVTGSAIETKLLSNTTILLQSSRLLTTIKIQL